MTVIVGFLLVCLCMCLKHLFEDLHRLIDGCYTGAVDKNEEVSVSGDVLVDVVVVLPVLGSVSVASQSSIWQPTPVNNPPPASLLASWWLGHGSNGAFECSQPIQVRLQAAHAVWCELKLVGMCGLREK